MEKICLGIVIALKKVGINAEFQPVNDIIASGKKISGSAQTKRGEWILQHGTLLVSSRIEKMAKALRISKEKLSDKAAKSILDRVTTVNTELNKEVNIEAMAKHLGRGFSKALNLKLRKSS